MDLPRGLRAGRGARARGPARRVRLAALRRRWPRCRRARVVGTSSLRRVVQLLARCGPTCASSRCAATSTRGCASSTRASYDAIVLAAAGLMRLGLAERIRARFDADADAAGGRPGRARHRGARRRRARCATRWRTLIHRADLAGGACRARGVARARRQLQHAAGRARALWQGDELLLRRRARRRRATRRGRCCARTPRGRAADAAAAEALGAQRGGAAARRRAPTPTCAAGEARPMALTQLLVTRPQPQADDLGRAAARARAATRRRCR